MHRGTSNCVLIWLGLASHAMAQIITTVAGTTFTFPSQPLPALNAPLGPQQGVATDSKGNVYVVDTFNNLVLRITPDGTLSIAAGNGTAGTSGDNGPATSAGLLIPQCIALDSSDNLYVGEAFRIRKVSNGIITTVVGNGRQGDSPDGTPSTQVLLSNPFSIAVDPAGDVYFLDNPTSRVRKISGGILTTVAGTGTPGPAVDGGLAAKAQLNFPTGIAVDPSGDLFIADNSNFRVRKVSKGIITTVVGNGSNSSTGDGGLALNAGLAIANAIAFDPAGNLYISDFYRIRKVSNGIISTIAGNGVSGSSGDGGLALNATLTAGRLAADSAGNVFVSDITRIRKIAGGTINAFAGNGGYKFSGDGGPATNAALNHPAAVAVDSSGNVYFADRDNNRIRKVSGGVISTIAGNGTFDSFGDGGPATNAAFASPAGVAVDSTGTVYIADTAGSRIRKVVNGVVTTVAGNGTQGGSGDGGPATTAQLFNPIAIAFDSANNLYIAEQSTARVRKVSNGVITTVAGNGTPGDKGDGGPATSAQLFVPNGVAVDSAGNLYIADTAAARIRKVSGGKITTVAGTGTHNFSGDGGPAVNASLLNPSGIGVDSAGNLYIADGNRIRKVSDGIISTVGGSAAAGFSGDGAPATAALFNTPNGLAFDSAGNIYIADLNNDRIRKVLSGQVTFQAQPSTLSFTGLAGAAPPASQTVRLAPSVSGLTFSASVNTNWLSVTPSSGTMPAALQVTADPSQLAPGTYSAVLTITSPVGVSTISATFTVTGAQQDKLTVNTGTLSFSFPQGAAPGQQQLTLSNQGSGTVRFTATASTIAGGNWLTVAPQTGTVTPTAAATLTVTATPGALTPGTYSGSIALSSQETGQQIVIPITLSISTPGQTILLSQVGLTFTAVAQGGAAPSQRLSILNAGSGTLTYTVKSTTQPGSSGWLRVSATGGTVIRPFLDVSPIDVSVDARSLSPGAYYGQIQVSSTGAGNSPQTAIVVLTVLPPGSNPGPVVRPTGLVFTGVAGGGNPGSQNVAVTNLTAKAVNSGSSITYVGTKGWITYLPTDFSVQPGTPTQIVVQPDFSILPAGQYRAYLTLGFDDGTSAIVNILAVVAPAGTVSGQSNPSKDGRFADACPTKLLPQFAQVGFGSVATAGYPQSILVKVVDDCGALVTNGSVVVSFTNGDPPLSLVSLQDGTWSVSWVPGRLTSSVTLSATAQLPSQKLSGTAAPYTLALQQAAQNPPILSSAPLGVGTLAPDKFAPGDLILVRGTGIANGPASSPAAGLQQQLAGASLLIGGENAPLLYADPGQMIGIVPFDLPVNTVQQVILGHDNALGTPVPVTIASTHPAILSKDGSGTGQALIYKGGTLLADASNPVKSGDTIVIFCTGLGPSDANGNITNAPVVSIGGITAAFNYAGPARPQNYPPAGAPTLLGVVSSALGGLYQIVATVPSGLVTGATQVSIRSAGQTSQTNITVAVTGNSSSVAPSITSINTAYGSAEVSQNDFIEIHGANLASATAGPASLSTQLGGVTVTVNGQPALLYYVSSSQINALTPLDNSPGPVPVVVTSNGVPSAPFSANMRSVTPSFLRIDASHITATHADYTYVGPATLGSLFTPAKPGEQIVTYGVGFGLPSTPISGGSLIQSGTLPEFPLCQISGTSAQVVFAGLNGFAGLYQLNVTIPASVPNGDNVVSCTYAGQTTPVGTLLSIQR